MILEDDRQMWQMLRYGEGIFGKPQAMYMQHIGLDVGQQLREAVAAVRCIVGLAHVGEVVIDAMTQDVLLARRRLNHRYPYAGASGRFGDIRQRWPSFE